MKILHINGLGFESGGVEVGIVSAAALASQLGHEVKILTSNRFPEKKSL